MGKNLKGVDEFLWLLVVAMIILVVAAVFSSFFTFQGAVENVTIEELSPIGEVGYSSQFVSKLTDIGSFDVGEAQQEELKRFPRAVVSASFGASNPKTLSIDAPDYLMDTIRSVKIYFDVLGGSQYMAPYGDLVVKWNGKEFFRAVPTSKQYTVEVNSKWVRDSNSLEVYAEGPGIFFWATTVYTLEHFRVVLEYGPSKIEAFTMSQKDLESFEKGEVSFAVTGAGKSLGIKVNGVEIYRKTRPRGFETAVFNLSTGPVKTGINTLSFDCPEGTYLVQNAELRLYLLSNEIVRTRTFNITVEQFQGLKSRNYRGKVSYYVRSISRPGNLNIKLNNQRLSSDAVQEGWNQAYFSTNEAIEGLNDISFSGTGFWNIGEVAIALEKVA